MNSAFQRMHFRTIEHSGVHELVGMAEEQLQTLTERYNVKTIDDLSLLDKTDIDLILGTAPATFMVRKKLAAVALFIKKGGRFNSFTTIQDINAWEYNDDKRRAASAAPLDYTTPGQSFPTESSPPAESSPAKAGNEEKEGNEEEKESQQDRSPSPSINVQEIIEKEHVPDLEALAALAQEADPGNRYPYFAYEDTEKKGIQVWWQVPQNFVLPKCTREVGWKFWLLGMPNFRVPTADGGSKIHPICPFRKFELKRLPLKIRQQFKRGWLPCYTTMEKTLYNLPEDISRYNGDLLESTYKAGTETLRKRAEYIFLTRQKSHTWSVATWSKQICRSQIMKFGTARDKANLPPGEPVFRKTKKRKRNKFDMEEAPLPPASIKAGFVG